MATIDDRITQDQFCTELRQANPSPQTCRASSPPSAPGIDPGWVSNGCGDGSFLASLGAQVAGAGLSHYTGILEAPFPGISFYGACLAHDRCWGMGNDRDTCTREFHDMLVNLCSSNSTFTDSCRIIAARFDAAVREFGDGAYANAVSQRACAQWAKDMNRNGCAE